jgi:hypothetical protein
MALTPAAADARSGRLLLKANFPAAMAAIPHGGLRYGELATGRIWQVDATGRRSRRPLARVSVYTRGLNGLLGLAVDRRGRTFAAWTNQRQTLMVAKVYPGPAKLVWKGPAAGDEANGGRLAFARDGRLLLSLGDGDRSITGPFDNPMFPPFPEWSGRIVSLDPNGAGTQVPRALASGWFNPFGLAVTPSGAVWVGDNAIGDDDHLARADQGPKPTAVSHIRHSAPSGLAAIDDHQLVLCGYASSRLDRYRIGADGLAHLSGRPLATDCQIGVIRLSDGRLAYANEKEIRTLGS